MGDDADRYERIHGAPPDQLETLETAPLSDFKATGAPRPGSITAPFDRLAQFASAHASTDPPVPPPLTLILPPRPTSVAETELEPVLLEELALKHVVSASVITQGELAERLCLPLAGVVDEIVSVLRKQGLVEYQNVGAGLLGSSALRVRATERGLHIERMTHEQSGYVGPAPVRLASFLRVLRQQARTGRAVGRTEVWRKTSHLVLYDAIVDSLGAGLESGGPILLHGASGNGKTAIASAIARVFQDGVLIPRAVYIDGHVVRVFDPSVHIPLSVDANVSGAKLDDRWVYCQAPFVRAGAELESHHLDLIFNQQNRYYECPIQLKAVGGVLLLDDLGMQRGRIEDLLYRCLEPIATGVDHLTTVSGRKIGVPFTPLVVVASSVPIRELFSEALLRRFPCKIEIPGPTEDQYRELFRRACQDAGIEFAQSGLDYVIERCYARSGHLPRACHAGQIVRLISAAARYFGIKPQLVPQLIDVAADLYLA
jgi:gluconate kinase